MGKVDQKKERTNSKSKEKKDVSATDTGGCGKVREYDARMPTHSKSRQNGQIPKII